MTENKALIVGVGMVKFVKPSLSESYDTMGAQAARSALDDAQIDYAQVQQAFAGFVMGDTCSGQAALYNVGLTGIPIFNVNNACATGSSALYLARQAILGGSVDVALAVGFEQMSAGALASDATRTPTTARLDETVRSIQGWDPDQPQAALYFGGAGRDYLAKYDAKPELFGQVSVKARSHAARNPYALFTKPLVLEEVMAATPLYGPLTRLMACPPTCGAAAVVLVSERYAKRHGLTGLVAIAGQGMATDRVSSYEGGSMIPAIGAEMTRAAAGQAYEQAGIGPADVDVVELHDCFSTNEVITYEALGLCGEGEATKFVADGDNTYGGRVVVNPSGGLLSKGHPLGATGLAQITELVWHLRATAGERQVEGARVALQHNIGLGGAGIVTLLRPA